MNEIGIILLSHGYFAKYAMESAEMIVGKQENYEIISVTDDKDLDDITTELTGAYEKLKSDKGIIILADIFGGTPCNAAGRLLLNGAEVSIYTGFSLSILLELILNRGREIEEVRNHLEVIHKESFINLNNHLKNIEVDEVEL